MWYCESLGSRELKSANLVNNEKSLENLVKKDTNALRDRMDHVQCEDSLTTILSLLAMPG